MCYVNWVQEIIISVLSESIWSPKKKLDPLDPVYGYRYTYLYSYSLVIISFQLK